MQTKHEPRHQVASPYGDTLGSTVLRARRAKGLSLRALAEALEASVAYAHKLERNEVETPSRDNVTKLAQALDLDPDRLLFVSGQMPDRFREFARANPDVTARMWDELLRRATGWRKEKLSVEEGYRTDPPWGQLTLG